MATPLRIVNLNPFHLLYGVPASFGAHVLAPGATEAILSADMASHWRGARAAAEQVQIDGETWRQALALRHGIGDGWEYLAEVSVVAHRPGAFDGLIADWHDIFGLPQSGRDRGPRDRLALAYTADDQARIDVRRSASALGDLTLGLGRSLPPTPLANDGLALRGVVRLPTGDEDALTGSGGFAASLWAEASGVLREGTVARDWLYTASLGVLLAEAPEALAAVGGNAVAFGRFGVTWRALAAVALTAQLDVHSSPYGASALSPLADPAVMFGLGGTVRLGERALLDIAVTEDDGTHHAAPDFGLHVALRWRL